MRIAQIISCCCLVVVLGSVAACLPSRKTPTTVQPQLVAWYDSVRQRRIPVALYQPATRRPKIVIFNHGYAQNAEEAYLAYSFLTEYLAAQGWFVVSIQHELSTDSLMPTSGIPQVVRRPFWERGATNIAFVIQTLKSTYPDLDDKHIALIGHSNGGDMTMLFPAMYPGVVHKVISLDNRRMALPRTHNPSVYTLRSSDLPADEGVLPTAEEQKLYEMKIIPLTETKHNDMTDSGTDSQKNQIRQLVLSFLKER